MSNQSHQLHRRETIRHFLELLWVTTEKELRARYKYTFLGFLWIVAIPLLQMFVVGFIFTYFVKEQIPHYNYFLYIGLLMWNFFSISVVKATSCIVTERDLVTRAKFPRIVLPMSIIISNLVHFILGLLLLVAALVPSRGVSVGALLITVASTMLLTLFTIGFSALTATLNVRFRDINFIVQALLILWFYATPIVYPLYFIEVSMRWMWYFNPLTSVIQLYQWALLGTDPPTVWLVSINTLIIIVMFIFGTYIFGKKSMHFADWI